MSVELVNAISQQGFHVDSPNFQENFDMELAQMMLQMGHVGQNRHAH